MNSGLNFSGSQWKWLLGRGEISSGWAQRDVEHETTTGRDYRLLTERVQNISLRYAPACIRDVCAIRVPYLVFKDHYISAFIPYMEDRREDVQCFKYFCMIYILLIIKWHLCNMNWIFLKIVQKKCVTVRRWTLDEVRANKIVQIILYSNKYVV